MSIRRTGIWRVAGPALVIVAAGAVAYSRSFDVPFVFDDYHAIVENPHLRRLWPPGVPLSAPDQATVAGRPVAALSLALNYAVHGLDVRGYHAVNLLLHLGTALLLLGVCRRTLASRRHPESIRTDAAGLAAAISLLWVVHPLLTEAVVYIVQRTELLAGFFTMLTLYAAMRADEDAAPPGIEAGIPARADGGRAGSVAWIAIAVAACLMGVLSKEVAAMAPLLVVTHDMLFRAPAGVGPAESRPGSIWRKRWRLYAGLSIPVIVAMAVVAWGPRSGTVGWGHGIGPLQWLWTQAGVSAWYLGQAIWPVDLALVHEFEPVTGPSKNLAWVLALAAAAGLSGYGLVRRRGWAFPAACFFLILAPTSSIIPIVTEVAAERRMYLPLAAVAAAVVLGARGMLLRVNARPALRRWVGAGLVAVAAGALLATTMRRVEVWRDDVALWGDAVARSPANPQAHSGYGMALVKRGEIDRGIRSLEQAVALDRRHFEAHSNLAAAWLLAGDSGRAYDHAAQAVALNPRRVGPHVNLGIAMARLGRMDEAEASFSRAMALAPHDPNANYQMAKMRILQDKPAAALEHLARALAFSPGHADAHDLAGVAMAMLGQREDAAAHFREALRLEPGHAGAAANLRKLTEDAAGE
jgi:Flp pilus assembly protein TadD